ncbi:MAG: CDP-alcohol phosphatidyltransferase family protein, partial [Clostridia bacterium]|nr:CDP-alcohol phosphatidyltransferase family protein [Clostridia bacterium]
FCLMFCGLCDMFDGKIARSKKNRTEDEKQFGIQIDSLCDLVCFGVLPAMICFEMMGERDYGSPWRNALVWTGIGGICGFYVLAGLIRLAFFNVTEESRQKTTDEVRAKYQGLPITSAALILPLIYIARLFIPESWDICFCIFYLFVLFVVGVLFITPFHIKKPKTKQMIGMLIIGLLIATALSMAYLIVHHFF